MVFEFLKDIGNYQDRVIGRDDINGITISTAFTSDEGFETALVDSKGVHPIERYSSKEEAIVGHKKWKEKMQKPPKKIIELGAWGIVPEKEIDLKPSDSSDVQSVRGNKNG